MFMSELTTIHVTHRKADPFTRILNSSIRDARLSFKARGLLAFMIGQPHNWQTRVGWIEEQTTEGREAIRSAITELEKFGYLTREKRRAEKGLHDGYIWHWHEEPSTGDGLPSSDEQRETGSRLPSTKKELPQEKLSHDDAGPTSDPVFAPSTIQQLWNTSCPSLPKVSQITASRLKHAKARSSESMAVLREAFERAERSDFIAGRREGKKNWANFDWLMKPDNWTKLHEGRYDNRDKPVDNTEAVSKNAF